MKLTFLGSGTSSGVPCIGCDCDVCRSPDPLNKRLRPSIMVENDAPEAERTRLLIDTTPDLRMQLLRAGVHRVSAILWTHDHNDHVIGLDDIRPLTDRHGYLDGYGNADTLRRLHQTFGYAFVPDRQHGGFPRLRQHLLEPEQTLHLGDIAIRPIPIMHGQREIFAYRFESAGRSLVYATDCSGIPDASWEPLAGADVLILDALRHKPHPTHFCLEEALDATRRLRPRRTLFTHMAHDLEHHATNALLPDGVALAYDELSLEVGREAMGNRQ